MQGLSEVQGLSEGWVGKDWLRFVFEGPGKLEVGPGVGFWDVAGFEADAGVGVVPGAE